LQNQRWFDYLAPLHSKEPSVSAHRNILIVDDNPEQCEILSELVAELGHTAYTAADGEQALQLFEQRKIDLVITDIKMPRMDGMALLEKVRQRDPHVRVIVVTGFPSSETILRTIENDGYTYLVKPVKLKSMASLIEKAFNDPVEG
jgi:DNA-binding NtrC family response regulator